MAIYSRGATLIGWLSPAYLRATTPPTATPFGVLENVR